MSVSFVVNLVKAFRMRGSLAPKPSGGRRHAKLGRSEARANAWRQERETSARMFPRMWSRLVMNIKGKRGLTQLGRPDELACDFESAWSA